MRLFQEGEPLTYNLATDFGEFKYCISSDDNLLHLYRRTNSINVPITQAEIQFAVIRLQNFNGFEKLIGKANWENRKYYTGLFDKTFASDDRGKVFASFMEYENAENNERKVSIENWRAIYERETNSRISEEKFNYFKIQYYEHRLPLLARIRPKQSEVQCSKCLGFGVLPIYFGINIKNGLCRKCEGQGTLLRKSTILALSLVQLRLVESVEDGERKVKEAFDSEYTLKYYEEWNLEVGRFLSRQIFDRVSKLSSNYGNSACLETFIGANVFSGLFLCRIPHPTLYSGYL